MAEMLLAATSGTEQIYFVIDPKDPTQDGVVVTEISVQRVPFWSYVTRTRVQPIKTSDFLQSLWNPDGPKSSDWMNTYLSRTEPFSEEVIKQIKPFLVDVPRRKEPKVVDDGLLPVNKKSLPSEVLTKAGRRPLKQEPYDPDARDGDNDGIVQEGTPWERPAATRLMDAAGNLIERGREATSRPTGLRVVDADGNDVDYTPTYERAETGTIGVGRQIGEGVDKPSSPRKKPDVVDEGAKPEAKPDGGVAKPASGTPLADHGATSLKERGLISVRESAAPPPPPAPPKKPEPKKGSIEEARTGEPIIIVGMRKEGAQVETELTDEARDALGRDTLFGAGLYFTDDEAYLPNAGKRQDLTVTLQNPYVLDLEEIDLDEYEDADAMWADVANALPDAERLQQLGYDGIIARGGPIVGEDIRQAVVFPNAVDAAVKIEKPSKASAPKETPKVEDIAELPGVTSASTERPELIEPTKPRSPYKPSPPPLSGRAQELADEADGDFKKFMELLDKEGYVVFDYETTGLQDGNIPVQIGAVRIKDGKIVERFNVFTNPQRPLSQWSKDNLKDKDGNPLTDEWLQGQTDLAEAHRQMAEFLGDSIIVAHNLPYDGEIIERMMKDADIDYKPSGSIDTLMLLRSAVPKGEGEDGPERHTLGALADFFGVDLGDAAHTADADSEAAALVLQKAMEWADRKKSDPEIFDAVKQKELFDSATKKYNEQRKQYEADLEQYKVDLADYERAVVRGEDPVVEADSPEYRMMHQPSPEGPRAHDLTEDGGEGQWLPDDVYTNPNFYSGADRTVLKETMDQLERVKGDPDAKVTIYRWAPEGEKIQAGNWVSLSKAYAEQHGASNSGGKAGSVVSMEVPAKDVRFAGDDLAEFGWFPEEEVPEKPAKLTQYQFPLKREPYQRSAEPDANGIVQAGTIWERPAGTSFMKPNGNEYDNFDRSNERPEVLREGGGGVWGELVEYTPSYERPDYDGGAGIERRELKPGDHPVQEFYEPGEGIDPEKLAERAERTRETTRLNINQVLNKLSEDELAKVIKHFGVSDRDELVQRLEEQSLKNLRSRIEETRRGPIYIAMRPQALTQLLKSKRYKSQFEKIKPKKKQGGFYNPEKRREIEAEHLGIPEQLPDVLRPAYGFMETDIERELSMPPTRGSAAENYGRVILRLRDSVRSRSTMSNGDSADFGLFGVPLDGELSDEQILAAGRIAGSSLHDATNLAEEAVAEALDRTYVPKGQNVELDENLQDFNLPSYAEVQIHGGFSVDDIEEVSFALDHQVWSPGKDDYVPEIKDQEETRRKIVTALDKAKIKATEIKGGRKPS